MVRTNALLCSGRGFSGCGGSGGARRAGVANTGGGDGVATTKGLTLILVTSVVLPIRTLTCETGERRGLSGSAEFAAKTGDMDPVASTSRTGFGSGRGRYRGDIDARPAIEHGDEYTRFKRELGNVERIGERVFAQNAVRIAVAVAAGIRGSVAQSHHRRAEGRSWLRAAPFPSASH